MGMFDKLKKKNENIEMKNSQISSLQDDKKENYSLIEMNNYMLSEVRKENLTSDNI